MKVNNENEMQEMLLQEVQMNEDQVWTITKIAILRSPELHWFSMNPDKAQSGRPSVSWPQCPYEYNSMYLPADF